MKKTEGYFQQSNGQLTLFQPDFIRDADCTKETPVIYGKSDIPIYGMGKRIRPRVSGRKDTEYMKKIYLEELLPLEMYDLVIVLISGGKDSIACYYKLLELGVPKSKIEFWHHDIDGGHPSRTMDWRCTANYIRSFAEAEQIPLRVSWRKNGFFGELYRIGTSELIEWVDPETGEIYQCPPSKKYMECQKLKAAAISEMENKLAEFGYRMKFPMKSGDLSRRWCSAYLKIMVADTVLRNMNSMQKLENTGGKRQKFPAKGSTHQGRWCSGSIDYVFVSHGDIDHMNGIEEMLKRQQVGIKIRNLVVTGEAYRDEKLEELISVAEDNGTTVWEMENGTQIREGKLRFTCLGPKEKNMNPGNEASMILHLEYEGFDMLFTGDVEKEGEESLTDTLSYLQEKKISWEVLKTAHHGSKNSTTEAFLENVKPRYAWISAGRKNRYGHPHKDTLERLENSGAKIYSTQENGAFGITVNKKSMRIHGRNG